jgi:hypothetical protein
MVAYLIINLREGDMVSIVRMYSTRHQVIQFMEQHLIGDAETSWWKVVEIPQNIQPLVYYDVLIRVRWETSNRVTLIGCYNAGGLPAHARYEGEHYFTENLMCE